MVREAHSRLKAVEKEGFQGGKGDNNWVVRHRHIRDPGIQQEPSTFRTLPPPPGGMASGWLMDRVVQRCAGPIWVSDSMRSLVHDPTRCNKTWSPIRCSA